MSLNYEINSKIEFRHQAPQVARSRAVDIMRGDAVVTTKDGTVIAGIGARDNGKHLEVTDAKGKSLAIPKRDISSQKKSSLSLMSAALTRAISEREFVDLMRFLLQQK